LARFGWQFPDNTQLQRYLYRVRTPTLIVWGERDGFVPAMHGQAYHEGIANSEFVSVPNAGHLPHVEQEMACLQIVLNFLRRSENPPPSKSGLGMLGRYWAESRTRQSTCKDRDS